MSNRVPGTGCFFLPKPILAHHDWITCVSAGRAVRASRIQRQPHPLRGLPGLGIGSRAFCLVGHTRASKVRRGSCWWTLSQRTWNRHCRCLPETPVLLPEVRSCCQGERTIITGFRRQQADPGELLPTSNPHPILRAGVLSHPPRTGQAGRRPTDKPPRSTRDQPIRTHRVYSVGVQPMDGAKVSLGGEITISVRDLQ